MHARASVRLRCAAGLCLAACTWGDSAAGQQRFPYTAFATSDGVHVRSGPGDNYYSTDRLVRGTAVEVYRHDPGGWYAIRPPEGSFSWVAADQLEPVDGEWARVVGQRVVARVGSRLSDVRDVIQVRLEPNEEVQLLDAQVFGQGEGRVWYKIAPPAGEFRWVFGRDLTSDARAASDEFDLQDVDSNHDRVERDARQSPRLADRPRGDGEESPRVTLPWSQGEPRLPPRIRLSRAAQEPRDGDLESDPLSLDADERHQARQTTGDEQPGASDSVDDSGSTVDRDRRGPGGRDAEAVSRPAVARPWSREKIERELADINAAVAALVIEEPTTWEFESLRARTEAVLDHTATAIDRGKARLLLGKIERFDDIGRRSRALAQMRNHLDRRKRPAVAARGVDELSAASPPAGDLRYDGVGKLTPVVSSKAGSPYFALLDEDGSVRCYVTPAPGVNLRHYVGRQVGLNGAIGYAPELKSQHVTAQRVTVLDQLPLR